MWTSAADRPYAFHLLPPLLRTGRRTAERLESDGRDFERSYRTRRFVTAEPIGGPTATIGS
jgi:hypothetical protein